MTDPIREALELAVHAMRAPLDDWKGELERKALDAARAALAAQPAQAQALTLEAIRDLVKDFDLDWHRGWTAGDEPNRFEQLCRAVERAVRGHG